MEITLRHGSSPVNLLHIFRRLFPKNAYGELRLQPKRLLELQTFQQLCSMASAYLGKMHPFFEGVLFKMY